MPMYNLIEYSDNYVDSSRCLWQFKRDKQNMTDAGNLANVTTDDSPSFKYKFSILRNTDAFTANANAGILAHALLRNAKIIVPLKYLPNFYRSLEMPLINCKIHLELNWRNNCVMSTIPNPTFQIKNTKFYAPIVSLSTKDNVHLIKQLNKGFK